MAEFKPLSVGINLRSKTIRAFFNLRLEQTFDQIGIPRRQ